MQGTKEAEMKERTAMVSYLLSSSLEMRARTRTPSSPQKSDMKNLVIHKFKTRDDTGRRTI